MSFKDLQVWEMSMDLVTDIYRITEKFPQAEVYGLTSQMRRAAVSIPSNIAEGNGRGHSKEYLRFLYTARGSLMELMTQLEIAKRLDFVDDDSVSALEEQCKKINMMLHKLIAAIRAKLDTRSGSRDPRSGNEKPTAGDRNTRSGNRKPVTGN